MISPSFLSLGGGMCTSTNQSSAYWIERGRNRIDEEVSYHITFADIEEFTKSFSKQIGKGSFGPVYFGRMKDGKDLAVEVMADSSNHGNRQFVTEVIIYAFFV